MGGLVSLCERVYIGPGTGNDGGRGLVSGPKKLRLF
jgi:hypothetical protein